MDFQPIPLKNIELQKYYIMEQYTGVSFKYRFIKFTQIEKTKNKMEINIDLFNTEKTFFRSYHKIFHMHSFDENALYISDPSVGFSILRFFNDDVNPAFLKQKNFVDDAS